MFDISLDDIKMVKDKYVSQESPLKISLFPPKEKRKYILLCMIVHEFEVGKSYSELEVNNLLKPIYHDFVTIRRYLVDYHFIDRKTDGSSYWLNVNQEDYKDYKFS